MQDTAPKSGARGSGEGWRVVDAGFLGVRVPAVGVFDGVFLGGGDGYAGVVQGGADCPEEG